MNWRGVPLETMDALIAEESTLEPGVPAGPSLASLEAKALHATLWTVLDYGVSQGLRVANSLILTRLLLPEAFGQMTLVSTLIVGITLLSDIGLGPSVIQSEYGDEPRFLNTAWTVQAMRGGVLWFVALLLTWPAAAFYHDRRMLAILPVLALSTLLSGFNSTNLLSLSRHMGVRRLFWIDLSSQILTLAVTAGWAWYRPSIWALVGGNLVANLYRLGLSHNLAITPGIRNRFCWDRESLHRIVHFGKWILLGTAFYFFAAQSDRLILGKYISLSLLGVYGIAFSISDIPRAVIQAFSYKVGYPFVAKIVHLPREEFRVRFLAYRRLVVLGGALLLSVMVNWGDLVIRKAYDVRYHEAAWMIPILALGLWHTLLYMTTNPALLSMGKSKYNALGNVGYCLCIVGGIPIAFHAYGMVGAVITVAAGDLPLYVVTQVGATREGIRPLLQDLQMTLAFLAMLAGGFVLRHGMGWF